MVAVEVAGSSLDLSQLQGVPVITGDTETEPETPSTPTPTKPDTDDPVEPMTPSPATQPEENPSDTPCEPICPIKPN